MKKHTSCRLCSGPLGLVYDYGKQPPANALARTRDEALNTPRYDLELLFCPSCFLGQLSVVLAPETLYTGYVYRSGVSEGFRRHCVDLARTVARYSPQIYVDVAGNDGTLAREVVYYAQPHRSFVVDPEQPEGTEDFEKIRTFWNQAAADYFVRTHGKADVITAQNVAGHVDDVVPFFRAVKSALAPDGVFIVEVPSFRHLIGQGALDTVYHEHVSYWTAPAMEKAAHAAGFFVRITEEIPVHCGSYRFTMKHIEEEPGDIPVSSGRGGPSSSYEKDTGFFTTPGQFQFFVRDMDDKVQNLAQIVTALSEFGTVFGITAGAKSAVLLNLIGRNAAAGFHALFDDTPEKQGKFSPGTGVEILPFSRERCEAAQVAVILSRNHAGALIEKIRGLGFRGVVVVP